MAEKEKRQDRRVQRTKKSIRNAFLRLLAEKDLEKISVKEIADCADVDRKTVYNYYNGVYDILDDLESDLADDFEKAIESFDFAARDVQDIFIELARLLQMRMDIYSLLMKIDNSRLASKFMVYLRGKIEQVIGRVGAYSMDKVAVAAEYVTSGMYMAYKHWFNSDRKQPLEEFTLELSRLVMGGLPSYFFSLA
jgi:AcrR family transcriptional regulator